LEPLFPYYQPFLCIWDLTIKFGASASLFFRASPFLSWWLVYSLPFLSSFPPLTPPTHNPTRPISPKLLLTPFFVSICPRFVPRSPEFHFVFFSCSPSTTGRSTIVLPFFMRLCAAPALPFLSSPRSAGGLFPNTDQQTVTPAFFCS